VWHDSWMCVTWLMNVCDMTHECVWHDSWMCVTWLMNVCDMSHECVWRDSLTCVTWLALSFIRDVTRYVYGWLVHHRCHPADLKFKLCCWKCVHNSSVHSNTRYDAWMCVTWLIDLNHWHDSLTWLIDRTLWRDSLTWLTDMTHSP